MSKYVRPVNFPEVDEDSSEWLCSTCAQDECLGGDGDSCYFLTADERPELTARCQLQPLSF